jgi:hypothetical protein
VRAHAGDRIVVESERVTQPPRTGIVEEVIAEEPQRLRVRWDDGHTTVFSPAAGAARIEAEQKPKASRTAQKPKASRKKKTS